MGLSERRQAEAAQYLLSRNSKIGRSWFSLTLIQARATGGTKLPKQHPNGHMTQHDSPLTSFQAATCAGGAGVSSFAITAHAVEGWWRSGLDKLGAGDKSSPLCRKALNAELSKTWVSFVDYFKKKCTLQLKRSNAWFPSRGMIVNHSNWRWDPNKHCDNKMSRLHPVALSQSRTP